MITISTPAYRGIGWPKVCFHEGNDVRAAVTEHFGRKDLSMSRRTTQDLSGNYRDTYHVQSPVTGKLQGGYYQGDRELRDIDAEIHVKVQIPNEYYSAAKPDHRMWCPTEQQYGS